MIPIERPQWISRTLMVGSMPGPTRVPCWDAGNHCAFLIGESHDPTAPESTEILPGARARTDRRLFYISITTAIWAGSNRTALTSARNPRPTKPRSANCTRRSWMPRRKTRLSSARFSKAALSSICPARFQDKQRRRAQSRGRPHNFGKPRRRAGPASR
jgi:hypothetical protein